MYVGIDLWEDKGFITNSYLHVTLVKKVRKYALDLSTLVDCRISTSETSRN